MEIGEKVSFLLPNSSLAPRGVILGTHAQTRCRVFFSATTDDDDVVLAYSHFDRVS